MSFFDYILYRVPIINLFILVIIVLTYFTAAYILLRRITYRKLELRRRFFETLLGGLKLNTISNVDDVVNIYKGIFGLTSENVYYRSGLNRCLREFLVTLIAKESHKSNDIGPENIIKWKDMITGYIKIMEERSPFADLPNAERDILSDISAFLENGNKESIRRKISELTALIRARCDNLSKIGGINKWSVPLAVMGIFFTLFFGIIALLKQ